MRSLPCHPRSSEHSGGRYRPWTHSPMPSTICQKRRPNDRLRQHVGRLPITSSGPPAAHPPRPDPQSIADFNDRLRIRSRRACALGLGPAAVGLAGWLGWVGGWGWRGGWGWLGGWVGGVVGLAGWLGRGGSLGWLGGWVGGVGRSLL